MDSRREFLKKAALLSSIGTVAGILPPSIQRAFAIDPQAGSTYLDAEHVVILMQENRSFDHCFGSLRGVRGFNDPRAVRLPDGKPVWLQTNAKGETYAPFRLNIKDTKATWMGSLPHSWKDQVDARNDGKHNQWLVAKKSGQKEYSDMPLTLGYYNREDLPFYYSLADAFTICDQNFCSSLTGTTANRLYLWTGKIREDANSQARVRNEETRYDAEAQWTTFPERLNENNISWKIYQNEISVGVGFNNEEDAWLANFTDNPIEWFSQYHVKFHPAYMNYLPRKIESLKKEYQATDKKLNTVKAGSKEYARLTHHLQQTSKELNLSLEDVKIYTPENYAKLTQQEKNIHQRAFTTNINDPAYHQLAALKYKEGNVAREMKVPKGDVLHQFREDVKGGKLPTVSWLVAPSNFSDHPGSPWYGAWYLSESMDILTQNPEVWKKTIFILCYDENDGYFDHVPPFVAPVPGNADTGWVSGTIDTETEHVSMDQELRRRPPEESRASAIGLGYRVPLVIASPWTRGGTVCSQVFDHTSILMFLEKFLSNKTGKKIEETNISAWRRAVCGDLTSAFKPYNGEQAALPEFVKKDEFIQSIHKAQFKRAPSGYRPLTAEEIKKISSGSSSPIMPKQEKGTRPSASLPYELHVNGNLGKDKRSFRVTLEAGKKIFKTKSAGSPFNAYAFGREWSTRSYAVAAGEMLPDFWPLESFVNGNYHLRVDGPNGFFREFKGNADDPLEITSAYEVDSKGALTGNLELLFNNPGANAVIVTVSDNAYGRLAISKEAGPGVTTIVLDLSRTYGWYDASIRLPGSVLFECRLGGRVETGKESVSDPAFGLVI